MGIQETIEFAEARINGLKSRLEKAQCQEYGQIHRTTIARLEGRIDALEEILAILKK